MRIRRNHGFAARTSSEVVNEIFFKSGATAADENNRVQRFWRDANTAALHSSIDWDTLSALYGMQQLGCSRKAYSEFGRCAGPTAKTTGQISVKAGRALHRHRELICRAGGIK